MLSFWMMKALGGDMDDIENWLSGCFSGFADKRVFMEIGPSVSLTWFDMNCVTDKTKKDQVQPWLICTGLTEFTPGINMAQVISVRVCEITTFHEYFHSAYLQYAL